MTKGLIIGLATIAITGAAVLATGMYAATDSTSTINTNSSIRMNHMKADPQNLIASLSGKVSTEALTAFQALITKHKTEMETMRTNSGNTIDKTQMEAKRVAFKAEIDALIVKYPELRTAMPTMEKGGIMNRGNGEIKTIIETLPTTTQAQLKAIHDEYKIKQDTLKNEEKAKIDAILAGYPEIKAKLDTMEKNHGQGMEGRGFHGKMNNKARDNNNKK